MSAGYARSRGSGILARIMFALKLSKPFPALVASMALLAGCASNPAPVANYSFGGSNPPPATATTAAPLECPTSSGRVRCIAAMKSSSCVVR